MERFVILFDGVCNLCNHSVDFVIRRDARGIFRFAPLQSESGRTLCDRCGIDAEALESIVLVEGERCYSRSTAALRIARRLRAPWPLLYGFIVVPPPVRDALYRWITRNRYRWFGKRETCRVATPELADRFLD